MNMGIKVFDTLGTITVITPPSMVNPGKISFCLINLKEEQKDQFAIQLNKIFPEDNITLFMYDVGTGAGPWIKQAINKARFVVYDNTNLPLFVSELLPKDGYEYNGEQSVEQIFTKIKESKFS